MKKMHTKRGGAEVHCRVCYDSALTVLTELIDLTWLHSERVNGMLAVRHTRLLLQTSLTTLLFASAIVIRRQHRHYVLVSNAHNVVAHSLFAH